MEGSKSPERFTMPIKESFKGLSILILAVLPALIIYGEDLKIIFYEALKTEALTHILLIPVLAAIMLYMKRDAIKSILSVKTRRSKNPIAKHSDTIAGLILCLTALLTYWYGSHTSYPMEYHIFSIPIFLAGTTLILSNSKVLRVALPPILFFLFLIPPPIDLLYALSGVTANLKTQASYTILRALNIPVTLLQSYGPPTLQLETKPNPTSFTIDLPCSGVYSLVAFIIFSAFLAVISKAPAKKRCAIFLLGLPIFEALNTIRITAIVYIAYHLNEETALLFHSTAGIILVFVGMTLTLLISEKALGIKILQSKGKAENCPTCNESLKRRKRFCLACGRLLQKPRLRISQEAWAKAILLIIGCLIVATTLKAPTFAIAKNSIEILSTEPEQVTGTLPEIEGYRLKFLYRDTSYERLAKQDAALVYAYYPENRSKPVMYASINVADTLSNLHSWEVCLISLQISRGRYPLVEVLSSKDVRLTDEPPIVARYLAFRSPRNYTQIILYWFERAPFNNGITVEQKYVRINLIILTQKPEVPKEFEEDLISTGKAIASYWEPIKGKALISLGIPALQATLALSAFSFVLINIAKHTYETKRLERNLRLFLNLATKREKKILNVLKELSEEKKRLETQDILKAFNQGSEEKLNLEELTKILEDLEKHGLIEKDITIIDDTIKQVWKTKI